MFVPTSCRFTQELLPDDFVGPYTPGLVNQSTYQAGDPNQADDADYDDDGDVQMDEEEYEKVDERLLVGTKDGAAR